MGVHPKVGGVAHHCIQYRSIGGAIGEVVWKIGVFALMKPVSSFRWDLIESHISSETQKHQNFGNGSSSHLRLFACSLEPVRLGLTAAMW